VKPVSYGYLPLRPGDDADRTRCRLVAYAEGEGFAVADIGLPAGTPMVTALAKRGARLWVLHR
jgi:hypothetical protein